MLLNEKEQRIKEKLKAGMVLKDYIEMCKIIEVEPTKGNGRKYHIRELERYCSFVKEDRKHAMTITNVYEKPLPKIDNRGKHLQKYREKLKKEAKLRKSSRGFFVYKIIKNAKILYIGKSTNIKLRMRLHKRDSSWFKNTEIYYAEVQNKTDMDIYEIYYITKLNPIHNVCYNNQEEPTLDLPELEFKLYRNKDFTLKH